MDNKGKEDKIKVLEDEINNNINKKAKKIIKR